MHWSACEMLLMGPPRGTHTSGNLFPIRLDIWPESNKPDVFGVLAVPSMSSRAVGVASILGALPCFPMDSLLWGKPAALL